jgi:TP901 family phage tail tape measure protein
MAGNIPMGSMSTEIKLNGSQSVKTLRELKQAVTQATSAWKAQRAELSTIGKSTEAAEAKYKGLAETIKKQKDYISGLQEAQKHLTEAQKSVDRSTKEGRQEYGKYNEALQKNETRIHSAEQKLASLTNQQTKAKSSLNYYKSGLADVQKQLKTNESVAKSYVVRLEAEGKGYESAKAKLNSYKDSLANLRKQQSIQTSELSRIARETGKSSDAYKRQEVRVNQTATSIAKLNSKIKSSQTEVNKLNPHGFNKLANGAQHVTNVAEKMKSGLKHAWDNVKTGATAAAAGIGAVGAAALSGAKKAGNLQQVYKEITNLAVTGGEKQREAIKNVTAMQRQGRDMSIKYGKSQQNIAEAFEDLVKRGYTTKQALGAMRTELQGSVASGDDFKDVVSVSSTVLESFGMRAKTVAQMTSNTKRAVNELAYAADMTSTGFKDLGYGMSYVGSSAHQAGFNLSETASAMGILSNNGLEASKAGTGLNQVINRLSDATGKLVKGDKKNALAKLGIKPKEITDSTGKLKNLATVFGVLNKHMKGMTKVQKINIMKSLFGMTGEQAGLILAKYNKQLGSLSKNVLKAGKNGKYVADLSAKNSQTAKMQMARLKQAGNAFAMTLGAKMLPAINEAGDSLVVFLTKSKDGKRLTNDFAKAVEGLATALANTIKWIAHHRTETKLIAEGLGAAYGVVKLASFVQWLNKTRLAFKGLSIGSKLLSGWDKSLIHLSNAKTRIGKIASAIGKLNGKFLSVGKKLGTALGNGLKSVGDKALSAGKFLGSKITQGIKATMKFSMGKRLATGALAGAAVATPEVVNAIKDRRSANKRSQDIGGAVGALAGGTLTSMIPVVGPLLAPVGAIIGKYAGQWGGKAVNSFTKGWQKNKPPKKFWSLENLGYSAHNMWKGFKKSVTNVAKWFKKNWKEVGVYFISPLVGAINSLYKHNKKFHKWANDLAKGFRNAWKGMTKWFKNLGKNMAKGLKSAWKGMAKWFSNIGKGVRNAWHSMTSWFTRLGSAMSRGLKATWHTVARWFGGIARGVQRVWSGVPHFFGRVGSASVRLFKSAWHGVTSWFGGIINGIKKAWDNFFGGISSTVKVIGKLLGGKVKVGNVHLANGTDWKKRYGYPAILNDGSDSPATGNREGILNPDGTVEVQQGTNVPRWIFPWQDVINAHDMARIFGRSARLANGTVNLRSLETNDPTKLLSTLTRLIKKKYDEDRQHHEKQRQRHDRNDNDRAVERERLIKQEHDAKSERTKIAKEIREALSKGRNTKGLTAQFNALTKHISNFKHSIAKTNPHHGQVYVDEGLLIGAKSRIGKSKWISDALFKKLTTKPKATHKRASTRKHRTTRRRSYSSRSYSSVSVPKVRTSNVSVGVSSKSVIVSAKVVGTKNVKALEKTMKRIKGGTRKITVKAKGSKSLKSLAKTVKKVKGKTSYIKVKTSGTHSLKSLSSHIASVHERVNSLNKSVKKTKFGTDIAEQAGKATKALKGEGNFAKVINIMSKKSTKDFKDMVKSINKDTNKIRKSTESDFSNMYKKSYSSMNRLHSGVIRLAKSTASGFGNAMKKMVSYASDSMRGTIRQINRGIRGIDRVLKQFGGNSSVINPVHFAGGTDANGRLTHDTLAVVNDATTGPRQEAIVTDQNDVIIPHGDNRPMMLRKGWGVLNGTQTQSLGLPHFAKGTGVKKDALRKLAENSLKHFADSFKSMFTKNIPSSGSDLTQGATDLGKNSGTHYGNPWSNAMWTVINNAIGTGGGTRAAFLRYAKETFDGVKYLMGAASKTLSDCSGMVMQALRHFGIDIGRTTVDMANSSGTKYLGKSLSKTKPGDLVIFGHGTGAAGHVGIINNPAKGTMFNETPPYARISKISDAMSMGYGYYRVKGLHDASKNHPKADPRLMALAKRELGHKALSWISDTLSENEGSMAGKPTGDHLHWMKQAHIPEKDWSSINWIVSSESGWNPHIVNPSSGTYGLGQMQSYNLHYYTRHGSKSNPIAQLMGIMDYIHDRYGSVANAVRFRKAHNWYANGGIANTPSIFGEAGPEMAIPLIPSKSTRAWELIGKAVGILSANSNFNNQQQVNSKEQKEEHDFRQAVLLLLTEIAGKSDVAKITLTTPAGRALWSIIQPFQKQDMKSEITRLRRGLSGGR